HRGGVNEEKKDGERGAGEEHRACGGGGETEGKRQGGLAGKASADGGSQHQTEAGDQHDAAGSDEQERTRFHGEAMERKTRNNVLNPIRPTFQARWPRRISIKRKATSRNLAVASPM